MNSKILTVLFGLCLLLAVSLACGQSAPASKPSPATELPPASQTQPLVTVGDTTHSLSYGGQERTYIVHVPASYDAARPTPLVFVFHGYGLNAEEMIRITGFNAQADASGFLVVYPNGSGRTLAWNGGDCCGEAAIRQVDDVGFVRTLIGELAKSFNLNAKRVYATGFSNGAIMAYRLACDLPEQIAAIGPVGATLAFQKCQPGRPISIIHFHGTADRLNPYEGGKGPSGGTEFVSVKDNVQFWVQADGCSAQAQTKQTGSVVHERYAPCSQGASVELYTIQGGEHAWPGGESVSAEIGEPTMEISATALMWEFFKAHPLP